MGAAQLSSCGGEKPVLDFVLRAMTTFALPPDSISSTQRTVAAHAKTKQPLNLALVVHVQFFISAAQVVAHSRRRDCHALRNLLVRHPSAKKTDSDQFARTQTIEAARRAETIRPLAHNG